MHDHVNVHVDVHVVVDVVGFFSRGEARFANKEDPLSAVNSFRLRRESIEYVASRDSHRNLIHVEPNDVDPPQAIARKDSCPALINVKGTRDAVGKLKVQIVLH